MKQLLEDENKGLLALCLQKDTEITRLRAEVAIKEELIAALRAQRAYTAEKCGCEPHRLDVWVSEMREEVERLKGEICNLNRARDENGLRAFQREADLYDKYCCYRGPKRRTPQYAGSRCK